MNMYSKSRLCILLIEDNEADAHLTKMYLEDTSHKLDVYHAETFYEGMNIINEKEVDIALLDLSLPDSSGFKTLTRYMEKASHIPVIVMTGINNEIIGNQSVKAGAQDFLVKGQFDGKLLGRVIRYSLQRFATIQKLEEVATNLSISEKRYEEAQKMAHFGNWQMDLVSNEMRWTDEIFRVLGLQPNSLNPTLSDYFNYVHPEDKHNVNDFFENVIKDGKQNKIEHRIITNGHTLKYVSLQAKVMFEEMTDKLILVGVLQDISERKIKEQLIIEKNISMKTSKIKEETIGNMSFHIRTPLSSIFNLLYVLENMPMHTQQKDLISGLRTSVDDLSLMLNNLLNFAVLAFENIRLEEEEFNLKELVNSIKKILQIKADNNKQKISVQIPENIPVNLIGDSRKIIQILHNLIDNAILHSGKNGKVSIHARVRERDFKPYLFLSVEDTGRGMTMNQVRDLLEAEKSLEIYQGDKESDSKRLGVAIVSKLSSIMGGKLNIQSKEGEGSVFSVEIPIKVAKQMQQFTDGAPSMPLRILLVEDHFLNQIATKKILTSWSDFVTVDIAENGQIGVDKFKKGEYDMILMDIQMPIMNGIEATQEIRKISTVPIIALTANASRQEAERCINSGCDDYLAKPFKPQDLYAKISNVQTTKGMLLLEDSNFE
jgi:DNA-binding response OmpR family regulator/signal transduction histidine kinase